MSDSTHSLTAEDNKCRHEMTDGNVHDNTLQSTDHPGTSHDFFLGGEQLLTCYSMYRKMIAVKKVFVRLLDFFWGGGKFGGSCPLRHPWLRATTDFIHRVRKKEATVFQE